jgi:hypothetical protein
MTDCSRDSNPPELLEEVGSRSRDWMLSLEGDVQKGVKGGGGELYSVSVCVCGIKKRCKPAECVVLFDHSYFLFFGCPFAINACTAFAAVLGDFDKDCLNLTFPPGLHTHTHTHTHTNTNTDTYEK